MNPKLELSIREAIAVRTGVIYQELTDYFDNSKDTIEARSVFFKLLLEYDVAYQAQIAVRFNIQINKLRAMVERANLKVYKECVDYIHKITHPFYGCEAQMKNTES